VHALIDALEGTAGQLVPAHENLLLLALEAAPCFEIDRQAKEAHVGAAKHPGRIGRKRWVSTNHFERPSPLVMLDIADAVVKAANLGGRLD